MHFYLFGYLIAGFATFGKMGSKVRCQNKKAEACTTAPVEFYVISFIFSVVC